MLTLTLEFHDKDELYRFAAAYTGRSAATPTHTPAPAAPAVPEVKAEAPPPKPTKTAATPTAPALVPIVKPEPAVESPSKLDEPVTLEQLSAAITAAARRNRDGVIALLTELGVKRASEAPQDQWDSIIAKVGAL